MKVLGVDPGLRTSGYAVVQVLGRELRAIDAGAFRVDHTLPLAERIKQIFHDVTALLDEHDVDAMAVEELYAHYKHPRTAILMGHARGAFLLAAAQRGIPVHGFSATRVKKSLTGAGRAGKAQVQRAVKSQLHLNVIPKPPDVADALAVAMCCINEQSRETVLS